MSFGTDELQAIVADIGTSVSKIGFAGNDVPHAIIPTLAGVVPAAAAAAHAASSGSSKQYGRSGTSYSFDLQPPRQNVALRNPLPEGLVSDWDAVTAMLDFALVERCAMPTRAAVATATATAAAAAASAASRSSGGGAGGAASKGVSSASLSSAAGQGSRALEASRVEASLQNNPFILAEHSYASKADREKWCELLFERFDAPGVFLSKGGIFSLYANARTTGITVDMGAGGTTVTPVQEGYPLMMGVRIHPLGGTALTEELGKALQQRYSSTSSSSSSSSIFKGLWNLPPTPPSLDSTSSSSSSSASWHASVLQYNVDEQMRAIKHSLCRVSDVPLGEVGDAIHSSASILPPEKYALPDGKEITIVGTERMAIPELLFDPFYYGSEVANGGSGSEVGNGGLNRVREARGEAPIPGATVSLPQMILASAMACEPDIRKELVGNLVLTGGASTMRGVQERLYREFEPLAPGLGTKAKWAAANEKERPLGAWLGGSILGSLGGFGEMWLSKGEYQEHGAKAVHLKCV